MTSLTTIIVVLATTVAAAEKPLWLVVGRPGIVEAVEPLAAHRREEGFQTVISTNTIEESLAAAPTRPSFLLLVGDDEPGKESEPWYLPAKRMPFYRWSWSHPTEFASDAVWGDLDGSGVPDIPVGRIPARTRAQADLVVRKILAYERQQPTETDLRLVGWGGTAAYGAAVDRLVGNLLVGTIQTHAPKWFQPWLISASRAHALCGWPPDQPELFTQKIRQGALLVVLIGHGKEDHFLSMMHRGAMIKYKASHARKQLATGVPAPPLVIIDCYSGNFTWPSHCMTESLLLMPAGPVATIGATTESQELPNYFSSVALLQVLKEREKRIGTIWLETQRQAMMARDPAMEYILLQLPGNPREKPDIGRLKRDQALMYAILGDPATRLRLPDPLDATVERTPSGWHWKAVCPEGATRLHVGIRPRTPRFPTVTGDMNREEIHEAFEAANSEYVFTPVTSPGIDEPWEGTVERTGWLRLVATGPDVFRVAAFELKNGDVSPSQTPGSP